MERKAYPKIVNAIVLLSGNERSEHDKLIMGLGLVIIETV